jgi:transcriptional regulator
VYIPEFNRIEDRAISLEFMRANPFAILISPSERGPIATHLPLLVQETGGRLILRGHFAKANHHWSIIEQDRESLVIFHGPHAYISPSLYEVRESVPTWNYATVHVYGKGEIVKDGEAEQVLADLIAQFDPPYYAQWQSFSEEYRDKMLRRIVAFEIEAARVEAKFKLGQNRTKNEQDSLIQALERSSDSAVYGVAALMRQQKLGSS